MAAADPPDVRRRLFDSHCHIIDHRFAPTASTTSWRSPRAERPFVPADIDLVEKTLGAELARKAFWTNPLALLRMSAA